MDYLLCIIKLKYHIPFFTFIMIIIIVLNKHSYFKTTFV